MKFLVPIDFTPVTDNALAYATDLSKHMKGEIVLLHVNEGGKTAEAEKKSALLQMMATTNQNKSGIECKSMVQAGSIFDVIGDIAKKIDTSIIVMGTHGVKGMQHIMGSRAMKVMTQSETPYIVVQKLPFCEIKNMLVPIDFSREIKQVLPLVEGIGKAFNAHIHLLPQKASDEYLHNRVSNNLLYAKAYFDDNEMNASIINSFFKGDSMCKDTLKAAKEINADMLVTLIDPETHIGDYIMGNEEQKIVANEAQIPVLCINLKNIIDRTGEIFSYLS